GDGVLALDSNKLSCDVTEFRTAINAGDREKAASLATNGFLNGFTLPSCPEFERWADEERAVINTEATKLLLTLAREATASSDFENSVARCARLTHMHALTR